VVVVLAVVCVTIVALGGDAPPSGNGATVTASETVTRGDLAAVVSATGTLTYAARPDGAPYTVINGAAGVYTRLPESGDEIDCGDELYRVDNRPVVLLCGSVPMYRQLALGVAGPDVRQLHRNLHNLGADAAAGVGIDPDGTAFTTATEQAVEALQARSGLPRDGTLGTADVVFAPTAIRVAKARAEIGAAARAGAPVMTATSDRLHVRVNLEAAQQGEVHRGDRVRIGLPGNRPVAGRVAGFGRIAQAEQGAPPASATIPTFITLDDPGKARGLDLAPVAVDITTDGVTDVLSVPVTALVGRSGGGYGVEVIREDGRRELVAVTLGLFDTGGGRVEVDGKLLEGDAVAVPSL
jgi:peptidoglycan hydrolase-like protein with peptidoglycan-binding domain